MQHPLHYSYEEDQEPLQRTRDTIKDPARVPARTYPFIKVLSGTSHPLVVGGDPSNASLNYYGNGG